MSDEWELCGWPMTGDIYQRRCNLPFGHGETCAREADLVAVPAAADLYINTLTYDVYRTHEWVGINPP